MSILLAPELEEQDLEQKPQEPQLNGEELAKIAQNQINNLGKEISTTEQSLGDVLANQALGQIRSLQQGDQSQIPNETPEQEFARLANAYRQNLGEESFVGDSDSKNPSGNPFDDMLNWARDRLGMPRTARPMVPELNRRLQQALPGLMQRLQPPVGNQRQSQPQTPNNRAGGGRQGNQGQSAPQTPRNQNSGRQTQRNQRRGPSGPITERASSTVAPRNLPRPQVAYIQNLINDLKKNPSQANLMQFLQRDPKVEFQNWVSNMFVGGIALETKGLQIDPKTGEPKPNLSPNQLKIAEQQKAMYQKLLQDLQKIMQTGEVLIPSRNGNTTQFIEYKVDTTKGHMIALLALSAVYSGDSKGNNSILADLEKFNILTKVGPVATPQNNIVPGPLNRTPQSPANGAVQNNSPQPRNGLIPGVPVIRFNLDNLDGLDDSQNPDMNQQSFGSFTQR